MNEGRSYLLYKMRTKFLLTVLLLWIAGAGCNVINPPEKVPTYIRIDSFKLIGVNPSDVTTHAINTAWVYFNNQIAGVYNLPANIPVIADEAGQIQVNPGVNFTGYGGYKVIYPFYTFDSINITPQPGKVIQFTPTVRYQSTVKFKYQEDFETGNTFEPFNNYVTDDTSLIRTNNPSLVWNGEGGSGYIYLTQANSYSQNINNTGFSITKGEAYIEIDYKCNVDFKVGLQATVSGNTLYEPIATIKPNEQWGKLYIGLQDFLSRFTSNQYRVVILAELPAGQTDGYVLVDNIKVLSY